MGIQLIRGLEHFIDARTLRRCAALQKADQLKVGGYLSSRRDYWRRHVDSRRTRSAAAVLVALSHGGRRRAPHTTVCLQTAQMFCNGQFWHQDSISGVLAEAGFDLLITYNSDVEAAEEAASALRTAHGCTVECVGGDISLTATRDEVFAR